jgi:L-fuculose-phosphate aldolase
VVRFLPCQNDNLDLAMNDQSGSEFFTRSAEQIARRLDNDMSRALETSAFSPVEKLALACRILADEGHARTLAGQITVRAESRDTFWTTHFGAGLAGASVDNLVRVDGEMQPMEGNGMPNPAVRFHLWIYNTRPDLNCIVHTHPPYSSALSMVGQPLRVAHMDAMMFYEDCAWLENWPGVPLANEEGRVISAALGQKRCVLLAHHGLLTTGKTLEEALYLAVLFEQAAQLQLLARSLGDIRPVAPHLAQEAHDFLLKKSIVNSTFDYWARRVARKYPDALGGRS